MSSLPLHQSGEPGEPLQAPAVVTATAPGFLDRTRQVEREIDRRLAVLEAELIAMGVLSSTVVPTSAPGEGIRHRE